MSELSNNEARGDFTHVRVITFTDLQAIGSGGTIDLAGLPAKSAVELIMVDESVAFAGSSTVDITIGSFDTDGAVIDADIYMTTLAIDAMTVPVFNTGPAFTTTEATANKLLLSGPTATTGALSTSASRIVLSYTDAGVASLTAGEFKVGIRILDLSRF